MHCTRTNKMTLYERHSLVLLKMCVFVSVLKLAAYCLLLKLSTSSPAIFLSSLRGSHCWGSWSPVKILSRRMLFPLFRSSATGNASFSVLPSTVVNDNCPSPSIILPMGYHPWTCPAIRSYCPHCVRQNCKTRWRYIPNSIVCACR